MSKTVTFESISRYTFEQLGELAKKDGVAAVCGNKHFSGRKPKKECFTYHTMDHPEYFVMSGKTSFADGYNMQWWLLNKDEALLGQLGKYPKGRNLQQFMNELPPKFSELESKLKPKGIAKLRLVHVLCTATEYQFEAYKGDIKDVVAAIRDLRT